MLSLSSSAGFPTHGCCANVAFAGAPNTLFPLTTSRNHESFASSCQLRPAGNKLALAMTARQAPVQKSLVLSVLMTVALLYAPFCPPIAPAVAAEGETLFKRSGASDILGGVEAAFLLSGILGPAYVIWRQKTGKDPDPNTPEGREFYKNKMKK